MKKRRQYKAGFTLTEIMLVVSLIAMLAVIAIPGLLRSKITANETVAQKTLQSISTALETYAAANSGNYPDDFGLMVSGTPQYIGKNYCNEQIAGYAFICDVEQNSYVIHARPLDCQTSGQHSYSIETYGKLSTNEDCIPAS